MTSVLKEDDKIFTMYRQYKELIHKDAEENDNHVYGTDQLAAQLTVAHMLDHVICLNIFKEDKLPTARKVNKFGDGVEGKEELEIMRNNSKVTSTYLPNQCKYCGGTQLTTTSATSSSANVNVKINNKKPFITGTATDDGEIDWVKTD